MPHDTFAVIATFKDGVLDDAYVCAAMVAKWHEETHRAKGFHVTTRRGFLTETAANEALKKSYPL